MKTNSVRIVVSCKNAYVYKSTNADEYFFHATFRAPQPSNKDDPFWSLTLSVNVSKEQISKWVTPLDEPKRTVWGQLTPKYLVITGRVSVGKKEDIYIRADQIDEYEAEKHE